jgi:threonine synthase
VYKTITTASCGNYGASIALASKLAGLRAIIYIPENYHTERVRDMKRCGAIVERYPGSYEDSVTFSVEQATRHGWYDANPGGGNTILQLLSYAEIAYEIYDALRDAPKIVTVPVSNGTLIAGIYRGFVSLHKRGKTSRIPKMVGASSTNKNAIIHSFLKKLDHCEDLLPGKIRETRVNEPLINWHSFDGEEALFAIRESGGLALNISDEKMIKLTRHLREKEGLHVLPASTAGLAALLEINRKTNLEPDRYVAVLTGKKQ